MVARDRRMNVDERSRSRENQRVAVVCGGNELPDRTRELQRLGVEAHGVFGLADLKATADRCEVMVIFVDGFQDAVLVERLRALADSPAGPKLIAVTDRVPAIWLPRIAHDRPGMFTTSATWVRRVLETIGVRVPARMNDLREIEPSGPELPFTD